MMLKKIRQIIVVLGIITITMITSVNAANRKTSLIAVQKESETQYLENDQGTLSKKIVNINSDTGEVTIQLEITNKTKDTSKNNETEIFLVIDNSPSMDFTTNSGKTRKELVMNSAKKLVESIFKVMSNVKIGIVNFHGETFITPASISNATLRKKLTNNQLEVINKLDELNADSTVSGTNIDAGIQKAESNFSSSCKNKVIILLTDGIPTDDVNGNHAGNKVTTEDAILVQNTTKKTLQRLDKTGIQIITMMTGTDISDGNTDKNGNEYENENTIEEELEAIERVFGTTQKPTVGKYYLVKSADISKVVENDILQDVVGKVQSPMNSVKLIDYFPKDIIENFEFSYVNKPTIGTISDRIQTEQRAITWNIETIKAEEVANVQYKLKIKDMENKQLLNKVIATNEKVVLSYQDKNSKNYKTILTSSPQIKLTEEIIKKETTDNTLATGKLPKAGINFIIMISTGGIALLSILIYLRYRSYKDIK